MTAAALYITAATSAAIVFTVYYVALGHALFSERRGR
jgi:hypothetical protein